MKLKIAEIGFSVECNVQAEKIYWETDYHDFLCGGVDTDVVICGDYHQTPQIILSDQDQVFDAGTFWTVHYINGEWCLALRNPKQSDPHCVGVFALDYKKGDIYFPQEVWANQTQYVSPFHFPIGHFLITSILAQDRGIFLHASGIIVDGKGYLFPASSEHGKTTMIRLWGDDATILNDERIVLRYWEGQFWIFGTPWHGEHEETSPLGAPLEKIFFLDHADENCADPVSGITAATELLSHVMMPYWDESGMQFTVDFCAEVTAAIPCYKLGFVPDKQVTELIRSL